MKKITAAPPGSDALQRNPRPLLRAALIVAAYLFVFIILDFFTKAFEELPGVVAWYPPSGLTYALLLVFGVSFAPAVTIALFISSFFIYRMPQAPYLLFLWAFIISLIYTVAAAYLRRRIRFDWQLRKLRDVIWFVITTGLLSALLAVLSVSSSALSSEMPRSEALGAIFYWWIGETVGVLTFTPFLLIYVMPGLKRFAEGQPVRLPIRWSFPRPTLSTIGQAASIALALYWVFGTHTQDEYHPLFLIALPLIWIALQHGFKGVSAAILALNSGVVLALWLSRFDLARLSELELLIVVNCIVGLLMGAVVTERQRAEEEIRQLNADLEQHIEARTRQLSEAQEKLVRQERLAALGQLAGSVSHELRNPLGVISNAIYYLKLVQPEADGKVKEYLDMIENETCIASKIVTELLDFTRIQSVDREMAAIPELVRQTLERFPAPPQVQATLEIPTGLPEVYADPQHIVQVLGNLVINACQAMPEGGKLTILARRQEQMVAVAVTDTGTGITPEHLTMLFEPLFTTKNNGIGLGLAVSRKLAEANGGRIEVQSQAGQGSIFTLFIPIFKENL